MKSNTLRFFSLLFTTLISVMVIIFSEKIGVTITNDFVIKVLLIISMPIAFNRDNSKK